MEDLKHQVMINQFVLAAGCLSQEAHEHLKSTKWQYEMALSNYFNESGIPHQNNQHPMCPPTNTPATPPAFPDALLALSKLQTSDKQPQVTTISTGQQSQTAQQSGSHGFMKVHSS